MKRGLGGGAGVRPVINGLHHGGRTPGLHHGYTHLFWHIMLSVGLHGGISLSYRRASMLKMEEKHNLKRNGVPKLATFYKCSSPTKKLTFVNTE